jgi:hypothetical protein
MFEGFTRYLLKELIGRVKAALKDGHFYSEKKKGSVYPLVCHVRRTGESREYQSQPALIPSSQLISFGACIRDFPTCKLTRKNY